MDKRITAGPSKTNKKDGKKSKNNAASDSDIVDTSINSCSATSSNVTLISDSDFDSSWEVRSAKPKAKETTKATIPPPKKRGSKVVSGNLNHFYTITTPKTRMGSKRQASARRVKHIRLTRNFKNWERRVMVKYLIIRKCIDEARGNKIWTKMIRDGILIHRTPFSLNNHFRKVILPNIKEFNMSIEDKAKFEKLIKAKK